MHLQTSKISSQRAAFPAAAGALCCLLGLTVLTGWYTHNLALIHILPIFVGMAYNAALGFLLGGISLAAAALGRPRIALSYLLFACVVGLPTLGEYLAGRAFGLDELLMPAYTRAGVTQTGRMAAATAFCFVVLGLVFLRLNLPERGRTATMGLLGAIIAGLGIIALSGYVTGITTAYAWGELTRMAVHTACGFVLMGIGIIALAWSQERSSQERSSQERSSAAGNADEDGPPRWLAGLIGIGSATVSLCIWQMLVVQERAQSALLIHLAAQAGVDAAGLPKTNDSQTDGALVAGLSLSTLMAWAVSLALTARRQSRALERARDELDQRVQERTAELGAANTALATANQAMRDVLLSVTDGKLRLCETMTQLPLPIGPPHVPVRLDRYDIQTLRHHVRQVAQDAGLTADRRLDLETAVGEAGMNAVVHGMDGTGEVYANESGTVQVWVTDRGNGIDMEQLPRATLERGYTTAGTLGHGFWLMLNTVDRVWLMTGTTGTTVVLEQDPIAPPPAWLRSFA